NPEDDEQEELFKRLATAVSKYWVCKRGPVVAGEALEVLGGNGYVEESGMPMLYREMPLNSIWEGSGKVQCLDVLRALARSRASRLHGARGLAFGTLPAGTDFAAIVDRHLPQA